MNQPGTKKHPLLDLQIITQQTLQSILSALLISYLWIENDFNNILTIHTLLKFRGNKTGGDKEAPLVPQHLAMLMKMVKKTFAQVVFLLKWLARLLASALQ
jgi:hypothetical protein